MRYCILNTPSRYDNEKQEWTNSAVLIAEKYGLNYLELNNVDNLVNLSTDFRDEGHVNSSGARKITSYMGNYFLQNYSVKGEHPDNQIEKWNKEYCEYRKYILEQIKNQTNLDSFLVLLSNCTYDLIIEIADSNISESEYYIKFIENLGFDKSIFSADERIYLLVNGKTKEVTVISEESIKNINDTCIGKIQEKQGSDGGYKIVLEDKTLLEIPAKQKKIKF